MSFLPVIVNDSIQSMGDGEHSTVAEQLPDGGLYQVIRFHVYGSCSFVQNQDTGAP